MKFAEKSLYKNFLTNMNVQQKFVFECHTVTHSKVFRKFPLIQLSDTELSGIPLDLWEFAFSNLGDSPRSRGMAVFHSSFLR